MNNSDYIKANQFEFLLSDDIQCDFDKLTSNKYITNRVEFKCKEGIIIAEVLITNEILSDFFNQKFLRARYSLFDSGLNRHILYEGVVVICNVDLVSQYNDSKPMVAKVTMKYESEKKIINE